MWYSGTDDKIDYTQDDNFIIATSCYSPTARDTIVAATYLMLLNVFWMYICVNQNVDLYTDLY